MGPLQERRFITGLLLVAAAIGLLFAIVHFAYADPFGGVPWPSHVEWSRYDVPEDGWLLVRPVREGEAVADTSTRYLSMPLPVGAQVYIPRLVKGRDAEGDAALRNRSASR